MQIDNEIIEEEKYKNKLNIKDDLQNFWDGKEEIQEVKEKRINNNSEIKIESYINKNKEINFNLNNKQENTINFNKNIYSKEDNKEYKPKHLLTQIILNTLLLICLYYYDSYVFLFIIILDFCIVWTYSLISILKNDFIKDSNKTVWLIALIFLPFITPYIYPDFKEIQTI